MGRTVAIAPEEGGGVQARGDVEGVDGVQTWCDVEGVDGVQARIAVDIEGADGHSHRRAVHATPPGSARR